MEDIPRYSYDLIDMLDRDVGGPSLPKTGSMWHALDENAMRMAAFQSGMRAMVDVLVEAKKEIEETKLHARAGTDPADEASADEDYGLGQVLGPDGKGHQTVASTHVAARLVDPLDGDSDKTPPEREN